MLEIAPFALLFGAGAAWYVRARRRAASASPPRPPLDPLLTVSFPATVGIGSWGSGRAHSGEVLLDARYLVLEIGRQRAVVERGQVRWLLDKGLLGLGVDHPGPELSFGLRRKDQAEFLAQARRLGWPLVTHR
jgi:hypothetical protein